MKLMTKEILRNLVKQDPHHEDGPKRELLAHEANVVVKFFYPWGSWTWYAISGNPTVPVEEFIEGMAGHDIQFYGLVCGDAKEIGYFWLSELLKVEGTFGLKIERDIYWTPITFEELLIEQGGGCSCPLSW